MFSYITTVPTKIIRLTFTLHSIVYIPSALSTDLFILFILILFSRVVLNLSNALNESEKGSQTSQHLSAASFLLALGTLRTLQR